jgi:hypothetical protein
MCFGATHRTPEEAESLLREYLPYWVLALLSAAALAALAACVASGVCEAAAIAGAVGTAAAVVVIAVLRELGVTVEGEL